MGEVNLNIFWSTQQDEDESSGPLSKGKGIPPALHKIEEVKEQLTAVALPPPTKRKRNDEDDASVSLSPPLAAKPSSKRKNGVKHLLE